MRFTELADQPCSITRPLTVLGDRWTLLVVKQSFAGIRRFEDFHSSLGISRSRLTDRLDRLVEAGILSREPYVDGRTRHEYRLTQKGRDLYPVLMALRDWGDQYMAPDGAPVKYMHRGCDGEVHTHLTCSSCGSEVGARDVAVEAGPGVVAA